jgi:murein DD-endopeptidase MepM/ murein hydrolase activator NlpD
VRNGRTAGFHRGLDYADWSGAPVVAPGGGVVTLVGPGFVLLGNCVVVNHGEGLTSIYMHLSDLEVQEGQKVRAGQLIGRVGSTGASNGPHLHYATYFHGEPIDPDLLLSMPREWAPETR